jgi:hypothetical protein
MEYLGPDRESIGREKAHVMRAGRPAIVSDPLPPPACWRTASDRRRPGWWAATSTTPATASNGAGPAADGATRPGLPGAARRQPAAQCRRRARGARGLRDRLPVTAQAVRTGLALVELPGRFQIVPGQPPWCSTWRTTRSRWRAGAATSTRWASHPRTHAVFGAMRDKDLAAMLARMQPLVDHWYFCDLPTPRAAHAADCWHCHAGAGRAAPGRQHPPVPAEACARRRPRRTPLIESSSSVRSTPWAACSKGAAPTSARTAHASAVHPPSHLPRMRLPLQAQRPRPEPLSPAGADAVVEAGPHARPAAPDRRRGAAGHRRDRFPAAVRDRSRGRCRWTCRSRCPPRSARRAAAGDADPAAAPPAGRRRPGGRAAAPRRRRCAPAPGAVAPARRPARAASAGGRWCRRPAPKPANPPAAASPPRRPRAQPDEAGARAKALLEGQAAAAAAEAALRRAGRRLRRRPHRCARCAPRSRSWA